MERDINSDKQIPKRAKRRSKADQPDLTEVLYMDDNKESDSNNRPQAIEGRSVDPDLSTPKKEFKGKPDPFQTYSQHFLNWLQEPTHGLGSTLETFASYSSLDPDLPDNGLLEVKLTKNVKIRIGKSLENGNKHPDSQCLKVRDILPGISQDLQDRSLEPGAYIIIGGPMSGKTLLGTSIYGKLRQNLEREKMAYLQAFEPRNMTIDDSKNVQPLVLWPDISCALTALFNDRSTTHFLVDSLRFLNADSAYPAKSKAVNAGLEVYATQLNYLCESFGKVGFFILSTSDSDRSVTDVYKSLLVGSCQGILVPSPLSATQIGTRKGFGEISLRNGNREYREFSFDTHVALEGFHLNESRVPNATNQGHILKASVAANEDWLDSLTTQSNIMDHEK